MGGGGVGGGGVRVTEGDTVTVCVSLMLNDGEEAVPDLIEAVPEDVPFVVGLGELVCETVPVGVRVGSKVPLSVTEADGVRLPVAEGLSSQECVRVGLAERGVCVGV